jgi:hypothetical protein
MFGGWSTDYFSTENGNFMTIGENILNMGTMKPVYQSGVY